MARKRPNRVLSPKSLRIHIASWAKGFENEKNSGNLKGVVASHMGDYVSERDRKLITGFLVGREGEEVSTKELSNAQLRAFQKWIDADYFDGVWAPCVFFSNEIKMVAQYVSRFSKKESLDDKIKDSPVLQEALELGGVITRIEE
jgi:hypothetical protein